MTTRLTDLPYKRVNELHKEFNRRLTAEEGELLLKHPKLLDCMVKAMRERMATLAHYIVHVTYAPLPGMQVLETKFSGEGSVSVLFDGREWERHSSCVEIDETPGERIFRLAEPPEQFLGKRIRDCWDDLAAHFDREGDRFAIEKEGVEFAEAQPGLQCKDWILALGSSALDDGGDRCVTMLRARDRVRVLVDSWVDDALSDDDRLLLVRKVSAAL
jgi:hypothetical protein